MGGDLLAPGRRQVKQLRYPAFVTEEKKNRSWEEHWAQGDVPWDAGQSSPSLIEYLRDNDEATGQRALVAGCGSGYDVFQMAHSGYHGVGIDLAPSVRPRFEAARSAANLDETQAELIVGDFFTKTTEELGGLFDLIWDYTFYCAIQPDQRDAWRDQMARFLAPEGRLLMLLFPVVPNTPEEDGPPFPLDPEKVTTQLSPRFKRLHLEAATKSHPGREGKEWFSIWKLR